MADDDDKPDFPDTVHALLSSVQGAIEGLGARIDTLVATQAATLEHVVKLQPVAAVKTEVDGTLDALDPAVDPPPVVTSDPVHTESPLRKFHNVLG